VAAAVNVTGAIYRRAMGALKGSVTIRRYLVRGDRPREPARLVKGVRAHLLVPIDPAGESERAFGWASIADPEDLDFAPEDMFLGESLALALRVDVLKPPGGVVKRLAAQRLKALGRRSNRAETRAAREEVKRSLRDRYLPTSRSADMVWQLERGHVYFWSHAKGMNELLVDLFARSFGLELVPLGPGLVAGRGMLPAGLAPTPEMVLGFPGLPGRSAVEEIDA